MITLMTNQYMEQAIALAKRASPFPNPRVGAVVVKNNRIIASAYHTTPGSLHAERKALLKAGEKAKGATLYITLEPCNHFGRTPPCTDSILTSGVKEVVVGSKDPLVKSAGINRLKKAGIKVTTGILKKECDAINPEFFRMTSLNRPWVAIKSAMSLDAKIATKTGHSKWITSKTSRIHAHRLRSKYDAIIVGIGTVLADNPSLTTRHIKGRNPVRIIVDSKLKTPKNAKVLNKDAPTIILTTKGAARKREQELQNKATIIRCGNNRVDLKKALPKLKKEGILSILVEGGSTLSSSFLDLDLVDELYLFIAPLIIGSEGIPAFRNKGSSTISHAYRLSLAKTTQLGVDTLMHLKNS